MSRRLVGLAAASALCASLAAGQALKMPKVELDYDREVDFSAFSTFTWKDPAAAARDPQEHTRIVWYVERELEKKGLKKAVDGRGDLFVRYWASAHEGLKGTPTQGDSRLPGGTGQLTSGVDFKKVLEGSLGLELQRRSDEKAVWRAATEVASIDKKRIDAETASAVRRLLAKYPPPRP
jgi:hypothetical protein